MPPLTLANLLAYVLQVSAIAAATGACLAVARVRSPRIHYGAWTAVLWLAVALPLVQPWNVTTTIIGSAATDAGVWARAAVATGAADARDRTPWNPVLLVLLAGTACRLLWLLAGTFRLAAIARRAGSDLEDAAPLQQVLKTNADVRYSADVAQPATCGMRRPVVLLPLRLRSLNASIRRAVLAHELLHVKRGDWTALMIEELLRAALWFNPAVWWLVDRVHAAREEVVDTEAVKYAGGRRNYVRALLAFADAPAVAAAPAFAHRRHLFARIKRLCEECPMSPRRLIVASALVTVAAGTSGVYAVGAFPIRSTDEVLVAPPAPWTAPPAPSRPTAADPAVLIADSPGQIAAPRYTGAPITLDLRRADLRATLRVLIEHGGREAVIDPAVQGVVTIHVANAPWDQALAFVLRSNKLAAVEDGATIRIAPRIATAPPQHVTPPPPPPAPPAAQDPPPPPPAVKVRQTPAVLRDVRPEYPVEARQAGIEGTVEVEVTIGEAGKVTSARVVQSSNPVFDQSAREAATQWLFTRPTEGPVVRTIELTFTLRNTRPATASAPRRDQGAGAPVRIGGNIAAPKKIKHVSPVYPPAARDAGVSGMVILELVVGADGRVGDAQVLRSIPLLDQAAIDAALRWEFTPTLLNGTPVPVIMTVTVNFTGS